MRAAIRSQEDVLVPSLWIAANAGSGKTSILVARVVALLLRGVLPERICCITYTKAAAGEMRERIVKKLRELLVMDDISCRAEVAGLLKRPATEADVLRARSLFALVLDSPYGGVQLTTIHGFCQQLLKKFPIEAGVPPLFSVLEDAEREVLQRAARHRLFDVESGSLLGEAISLLADRSGEVRVGAILDAIDNQPSEWHAVLDGASPEYLRGLIYDHLDAVPGMDADTLRVDFCGSVLSEAERRQLRAALPEFLNHKNNAEQKLGGVLDQWLAKADDLSAQISMLDVFLDGFLTKEWTARKIGKNAPLPDLLARIQERCLMYVQRIASLACAEESAALMMVASAYLDLMQQLKFERQALDYQDLIDRASELLTTRSMIGWVMRKLDHRIDHLLIDEAQDTAPAQWRIARALVDELIATNDGVGSGDVPRTLLVVGDEKQSIFSFQGAAPMHFASEENYFQAALSESNAPMERQALRVSYRSAQAVLRAVDAVAAIPVIARALSSSGILEEHQLHRHEAVGCVTQYPLMVAPEKATPSPFMIPMEYVEAQSAAQLLAEQIAAQIDGWLKEKRLLQSEGRAVTPGDILILVHRRRPMAPALIRALEKLGRPVSGLDRLMLSKHLAVRDLLALMAWCMNAQDDLSLAHVLRSPIIGMSDAELRALAVHREGSLWEALQAHAVAAQLHDLLGACELPPYEFLTHVLEVRGARQRFAERFGEEVHEILDELKGQAARVSGQMVPTIAWFYDWMGQSERVIKREQEAKGDQVRIMTVHGAKGLEAPIVILADTMSMPDLRKEIVYFASDGARKLPLIALSDEAKFALALEDAKAVRKTALQEEYQRLLYVALTRARDELHIYGASNKEPKSGMDGSAMQCWYNSAAMALKEIPETVTLSDGSLQLRDAEKGTIKSAVARADTNVISPPAWLRRAPVEPVVRIRVLSSSRLGQVEHNAAGGGEDAAERGVRIHRVLQWLRAESAAEEIAAFVRMVGPDWDAEVQHAVAEEIRVLHVKHRWLWEHPAQVEMTIAGTINVDDSGQLVLGQIDRLVVMPDAYVIVDYKTGRAVPKNIDEVPENYVLQLRAYRDVLAQIYADKPIRMALVYTANAEVVWVE